MPTVFMPLLNEGTDVWAPVEATEVEANVYKIEPSMNEDLDWMYPAGALVQCQWRTFRGGQGGLAVVGRVG